MLGKGGMASVYSARQLSVDREVAIKWVEPQPGHSQQFLLRLENEARTLAGLQHPHIVELYQFGRTPEGGLYYVMPLLAGGDLRAWQRPVDEARVIKLLLALLDALQQAHAAGIVHRDIKPENILFDRQGRPLLADFGAALLPQHSRLTREGQAIGSTGYMSPEQARAWEVDPRADLYSVGVLAYELLTGEMPFDGPDDLSIALAQWEQPIPRLPKSLRHWQSFIDRALAVDPNKRFADAAIMRQALLRLQRRRRDPFWRIALHPLTPWVGGAVLLLLALVWWWPVPSDSEQIGKLIESGVLMPPPQPNALDLWLAAESGDLGGDERAVLRGNLLDKLADEVESASRHGDLQAFLPLWSRWQQAIGALQAEAEPRVLEVNRGVEKLLEASLSFALDTYDPAGAESALSAIDRWTLAPKHLLDLAAQVRSLPAPGAAMQDPNGPPLIVARAPKPGLPGVAITQHAISPLLWGQFQRSRGRQTSACNGAPQGLQGCIGHGEAKAFAAWLSQESGHPYRLPDRQELAALIGNVASAKAWAWTSSCNEVRHVTPPNVGQRAVGKLRQLFGGKGAQPKVETKCEGHIALSLNGSGASKPIATAGADTVLVLLREMPAPSE
nr:serine/threonine-protein kinase [Pseudomarimonas arenosa]